MNKYSTEQLNSFDSVSNLIYHNLWSYCKDNKRIVIKNFDFKNKDHLLLLEIALIIRNINDWPIYIQGSWIEAMKWNFKNRKRVEPIQRIRKCECNDCVTPYTVLGHTSRFMESILPGITYGDIYTEYYGKEWK